jgi:hypothetical protein
VPDDASGAVSTTNPTLNDALQELRLGPGTLKIILECPAVDSERPRRVAERVTRRGRVTEQLMVRRDLDSESLGAD